ncbi:YrhK family protein [Nocardiopsis nanhaiensis]
MAEHKPERPLVMRIGHHELVVRQRYEAVSIANDLLIALWFIAGSILFFFPDQMTLGTWCFLAGSVELLIRPLIRLSRQVHLRRMRARGRLHGLPPESALDY